MPRSRSPTRVAAPTAVEIVSGTTMATGASRNTASVYEVRPAGDAAGMAACVFFGRTSRVVASCSTTRASCTRVTASSRTTGMTKKKMAPRITIGSQKSFDSMQLLAGRSGRRCGPVTSS